MVLYFYCLDLTTYILNISREVHDGHLGEKESKFLKYRRERKKSYNCFPGQRIGMGKVTAGPWTFSMLLPIQDLNQKQVFTVQKGFRKCQRPYMCQQMECIPSKQGLTNRGQDDISRGLISAPNRYLHGDSISQCKSGSNQNIMAASIYPYKVRKKHSITEQLLTPQPIVGFKDQAIYTYFFIALQEL